MLIVWIKSGRKGSDFLSDKIEYDTILSLARKSNFKKIMIIRDSWNTGNWYIVNSIEIKPDGEHCKPYGYIKYANNKQKLAAFIHDNPRMVLERNAAMVISAATHTTINIPEKENSIDMCKAIEEMLADAIAEGENRGLTQGRLEGKNAGLIEGKFESLAELVKDELLDINEAAKRANMSVEEFEEKMLKISK